MATNRVLIVDDALIIRKRIKEVAQEAGWERSPLPIATAKTSTIENIRCRPVPRASTTGRIMPLRTHELSVW